MKNNKFTHLTKITIQNIFRRKVRSILTITSVIIGIASVIALVLLSEGLFNAIEGQFQTMGTHNIFIAPISFASQGPTNATRMSDEDSLSLLDVKTVKKMPEVEDVFPVVVKIAKVEFKKEDQFVFNAIVPQEEMDKVFDVMGMDMRDGDFLGNKKGRKVIIGPYIADKMFESKIKVGSNINIDGTDFKVVGILEPIGNSDDDGTIYMTREASQDVYNIGDSVDRMIAKVRTTYDPELIANKIEKKLEKIHEEDSIVLITTKQILDQLKKILGVLKAILVSIAAISIVVGSIGIMNSIFTSVLERTKEIGVLKSIGAKINDILFIFVIESMILCTIGGIIGLGLGIVIARFVELYAIHANYDILHIIVTPQVVALAIVLSLIIGFTAGILPAYKASKMNIVDALRNNL